MDFDEFAMWIMNSEFKPVHVNDDILHEQETSEVRRVEALRKKMGLCIQENIEVFQLMKKKISYLEFISDVNRKNMKITEVEAREIFRLFDPKDSGYMDSIKLIHWAKNGLMQTPRGVGCTPRARIKPNLQEAIIKVCGKNSFVLEKCISHIPKDKGIKISFEEFRRALLEGGIGQVLLDCRDLFDVLGGDKTGFADIDLLRKHLKPLPDDPVAKVSEKKQPAPQIPVSRADRKLREEMRKSFLLIKGEVEAVDKSNSGYIEVESLYKIIMRLCTPLSFQDFRRIIQQLKTEEFGSKVNHRQFLECYNPRKAPHILERSTASLPDYDDSSLSGTITSKASRRKPQMINNNYNDNDYNKVTTSKGSRGYLTAEERAVWHNVLKDCHKADKEKTGLVSKNVFLYSIERSNQSKALKDDTILRILSDYTLSNGLMDYLTCFREMVLRDNNRTAGLKSSSSSSLMIKPNQKELFALHPWEFDYKKGSKNPYWQQATSLAREVNVEPNLSTSSVTIPSSNDKTVSHLKENEKSAILSQYSDQILQLCSRSYEAFIPVWRELRNEFKKNQIVSQRGTIVTEKFLEILERHQVNLKKNDLGLIIRAFRGLGMQDVVKFDEYLRVCLLVKSSKL
jgi:Ca2+-binding EF-hand superfamily protein